MTVALIDYGSGNLHSAAKALERVGGHVVLATEPRHLEQASHIVLPGVGAFADCMQGLQQSGLIPILEEQVLKQKKPFLGICVGMQLLAETGLEHGQHQGLGWIKGSITPFNSTTLKIPHMGWNNINIMKQHPVLNNIQTGMDFYFVHSYHLDNNEYAIAECDYTIKFPCIVAKDNIIGTQFHPEKSQQAGLRLLENFLDLSFYSDSKIKP